MKNKALLALLVSGCLGFSLGFFRFPTWQVAVETAQVLAGQVRYPPDNPFYLYHTKLWTILHQIGALMLWAGVSTIALSKLISGLLGMLSFQALTMFMYGLSRKLWLALASTLVIFLTGAAEQWDIYPVMLMATTHTYGVLGLSFGVLVIGMIGSGFYRTAGFLLGLAPAVHPSIGTWIWLTVGICLIWDRERLRREFRPALEYFAAGCVVTLMSLLIQLTLIYQPPSQVDAEAANRYFTAWVAAWDTHRGPAKFLSRAVLMNLGAIAVSLGWLVVFRTSLSRSTTFVLRFVLVTALLALVNVLVTRVPPGLLPATLLILMPGRVITFGVMLCVATVLGLLGSSRSRVVNLALPLVLLAGIMMWRAHSVRERGQWSWYEWSDFHDASNDRFFAAVAAERNGLVATGGTVHLLQLQTGRPVLIDGGGLDGMMYARESAPEVQRILQDVYDLDLLNPPLQARRGGVNPDDPTKGTWEQYTPDRWTQIGRAHHVTQVVTYADWSLNLPLVAQNDQLRLYRIPE